MIEEKEDPIVQSQALVVDQEVEIEEDERTQTKYIDILINFNIKFWLLNKYTFKYSHIIL